MGFSAWGVELVNEWDSEFKGKHKRMTWNYLLNLVHRP